MRRRANCLWRAMSPTSCRPTNWIAPQHGTSAALEFGVQALRVKHIVVLGHAFCGGIRAFADEQEPLSPGDFIGRWMSQIAPAAERLGRRDADDHAYLHKLELAAIELSLQHLMTFPCVRILVERGKLQLHGAYFGVASGACWCVNRQPADLSLLAIATWPAHRKGQAFGILIRSHNFCVSVGALQRYTSKSHPSAETIFKWFSITACSASHATRDASYLVKGRLG